jgi:uncharacterized protein (DUF1697 family)
MRRYVALLRGVNVGGAKRVPMAEWRALLEAMGGTRVRTLLNSGNAAFWHPLRTTKMLEAMIHGSLARSLGVEVPVIVKPRNDIAAIVAGNAFADKATDPSRLLVAITRDAESLAGLAAIAPLVKARERFHLGEHAAYLWCAGGILESAAARALLGKAGREATTRNWATVLKLEELIATI